MKVDVFEKYGIKYIRILQHEKGGKKFIIKFSIPKLELKIFQSWN